MSQPTGEIWVDELVECADALLEAITRVERKGEAGDISDLDSAMLDTQFALAKLRSK